MSQGIAIGIPIGIPIGIAIGNIGIGPAIGAALGVAIGASLEKKHASELRPLTKKEKEFKMKMKYIILGFLLLGMITFVVTYFMAK